MEVRLAAFDRLLSLNRTSSRARPICQAELTHSRSCAPACPHPAVANSVLGGAFMVVYVSYISKYLHVRGPRVADVTRVSCNSCGHTLDPTWARLTPRPPCPECGERGVAISMAIASEISFASSLRVAMVPAQAERSWLQRWRSLEQEMHSISGPISPPMSGTAINTANQRLQSFFIQAYHLKDSLIADSPNGIDRETVENAISTDSRLALLADLANLDKHRELSRAPRSRDRPSLGQVKGVKEGAGDEWILAVEILHMGRSLDGLTIASDAMAAWEQMLKSWGVL